MNAGSFCQGYYIFSNSVFFVLCFKSSHDLLERSVFGSNSYMYNYEGRAGCPISKRTDCCECEETLFVTLKIQSSFHYVMTTL